MKTRGDDGQVVMVAVISARMQCFLCHVLWSTVSQHQFNITLEESTDCCFAFFWGGGGWLQSIDWSVCLSGLHVACGRGSLLLWQRCKFVNDIMFSRNANECDNHDDHLLTLRATDCRGITRH